MHHHKNDHSGNAQRHRPQHQEDNTIHTGTVNPTPTTEEGTMHHRHPRTRALRNDERHTRRDTRKRAHTAIRGFRTLTRPLRAAYRLTRDIYTLTLTTTWTTNLIQWATTQPWWPGN